jgi:hypothetical protein
MNVYLHHAIVLYNDIAQPTFMVVSLVIADGIGKVLMRF